MASVSLLLALDLAGVFAFALNGAFTAVRQARLDIVGVLALGIITAIGGGIVRDVLIDALPPATFVDWRYLAVAAAGALIAFFLTRPLERLVAPMIVLDAAGLSLFCVTGASKALTFGLGAVQAVILGAVTGVGGGTIRDVLIGRVPSVLTQRPVRRPGAARRHGDRCGRAAARLRDRGGVAGRGAVLRRPDDRCAVQPQRAVTASRPARGRGALAIAVPEHRGTTVRPDVGPGGGGTATGPHRSSGGGPVSVPRQPVTVRR